MGDALMPLNVWSIAPAPAAPRFGTVALKSRTMSPKPGFYQLRVELTKDEFARYPSLISDQTKGDGTYKTEVQLDYNAKYTPPFIVGEPGRQLPPSSKDQLRELTQLLMTVQPTIMLGPGDLPKPDFDRQFYQGIALFLSLVAHAAVAQLPDPPPPEPLATETIAAT
jgi:hypothetical protein